MLNPKLLEVAFLLNVYNQFSLTVLIIIFLIEWKRVGRASSVYKILTGLFCAMWYNNLFIMYARYLTDLNRIEEQQLLFQHYLWEYRLVPTSLFLSFILVLTLFRIRDRIRGINNDH
jgi:hypothetical protein